LVGASLAGRPAVPAASCASCMASEGPARHQPPEGRAPWEAAAVGGGGGIMSAVLQDHSLGWVIVIGFATWLIHDIVIAWISRKQ
jgi:hypothetical protein